jgi:hypothetical protein
MGLIDENDNKKSIVNLMLLISILLGFGLFGYALITKVESAFIPLAGVLSTAIGGIGIKAYNKTS